MTYIIDNRPKKTIIDIGYVSLPTGVIKINNPFQVFDHVKLSVFWDFRCHIILSNNPNFGTYVVLNKLNPIKWIIFYRRNCHINRVVDTYKLSLTKNTYK